LLVNAFTPRLHLLIHRHILLVALLILIKGMLVRHLGLIIQFMPRHAHGLCPIKILIAPIQGPDIIPFLLTKPEEGVSRPFRRVGVAVQFGCRGGSAVGALGSAATAALGVGGVLHDDVEAGVVGYAGGRVICWWWRQRFRDGGVGCSGIAASSSGARELCPGGFPLFNLSSVSKKKTRGVKKGFYRGFAFTAL
jgi:hypothetical protein